MPPGTTVDSAKKGNRRHSGKKDENSRTLDKIRHFGNEPGILVTENPKDQKDNAQAESDRHQTARNNSKNHYKWLHQKRLTLNSYLRTALAPAMIYGHSL
jgi:hypothetical protein